MAGGGGGTSLLSKGQNRLEVETLINEHLIFTDSIDPSYQVGAHHGITVSQTQHQAAYK